ncbi:MAG: hypothetical protein RMJ43_11655, partial [Chloroherpetonaceae bacterium]|nr:hypothetical protein [Chloroherpetonaceae bacterium]
IPEGSGAGKVRCVSRETGDLLEHAGIGTGATVSRETVPLCVVAGVPRSAVGDAREWTQPFHVKHGPILGSTGNRSDPVRFT